MRVLWIGGTHPRHLYYINVIHAAFPLAGAIVEQRETLLPQPPPDLAEIDRTNFLRHFENRARAEAKYFGEPSVPKCVVLEVTEATLSSERSVEFVRSVQPDVVLVFGSGMIRPPLADALPKHTINLHLGLSPRYRGAATLFWPFYFLEPPYAGTTFHYIVQEPDAGAIIHQVVPELSPEDGIHDVACKAVVASAREAIPLLDIFRDRGAWKTHVQRATGKNFLASDFKPEHLRVIYNVYHDDMVREYLEGRLRSKVPKLVRQF